MTDFGVDDVVIPKKVTFYIINRNFIIRKTEEYLQKLEKGFLKLIFEELEL